MRKSRQTLSDAEFAKKQASKAELMAKEEKVIVTEPFTGSCDNTEHPHFTIKVTVDKPWAACYYCSKLWILEEG